MAAPETIALAAGSVIFGSAIVGVGTTLGMMAVGDTEHGTWGNVAISTTGFFSLPLLGGAANLAGTELYNAAQAIGSAFNIPLNAATANWN